MGRTKGTKNKNKNVNTAKNKNVININVNSNTSTTKRGKGRPRKNETKKNNPNDLPPNTSSGYNSRPQYAPPPIPIITPAQDGSISMLSQFLTSKILNDSNRTINLPETTNLNYTKESVEPSRTFNSRESIIPRIPDTPPPKHNEIVNEIKPAVPPPPPPPPPPPKPPKEAGAVIPKDANVFSRDAMMEEMAKAITKEGREKMAQKRAQAKIKEEARRLEKQAAPQQSTTEFLNMSFEPPKRDIVEMMTPQKETKSTALTPYKEHTSFLDFLLGGKPPKTKEQLETEKKVNRLKKLKRTELRNKDLTKPKKLFEYNDLKSELTGVPNTNKDIASSMINRAIKSKLAKKELENKREQRIKEEAVKIIQSRHRGNKTRQQLANDKDLQNNIASKIKYYTDAASEYKTRGKYDKDINDELSNVLKMNRTGLHNYKKSLGLEPKKKPGPKPRNKYKGLKQTEI